MESLRANEEDGRRIIAAVRKNDGHLTPIQRRRREMLNILVGTSSFAERVRSALANLSIPEPVFLEWISDEDKLFLLIADIPQLNASSTLMLERDKNPRGDIGAQSGSRAVDSWVPSEARMALTGPALMRNMC